MSKVEKAPIVISLENKSLVATIEDMGSKIQAVDVSSMTFYREAKAIYTSYGQKNAEEAHDKVANLIAEVLGEAHTKSVVNRAKKINGIVYDAYKNSVKIVDVLTTFGNIESVTKFIGQMDKAAKEGEKIFFESDEGRKVVEARLAKAAMTKAVNDVSKKLMKSLKVDTLTDKHYRLYNDTLTEAISDVKHKYTTERTEEAKFASMLKSLEDIAATLSPEQRARIMAAVEVAEAKIQEPKTSAELEKEVG